MGTSANILIKFKNKEICLYNHLDSYFKCLGIKIIKDLIKLLNENRIDKIIEKFDTHTIITDETEHSKKIINKILEYINIESFRWLEKDIIKIYKNYKEINEENKINDMILKEKYLQEIETLLEEKYSFRKHLINELFKDCKRFKESPWIYLIKYTCNEDGVYSVYKLFNHPFIYDEYRDCVDYEYVIDFNKELLIIEYENNNYNLPFNKFKNMDISELEYFEETEDFDEFLNNK